MTASRTSFRREQQDIVPLLEIIGPQDIVPVWLLTPIHRVRRPSVRRGAAQRSGSTSVGG